MTPVNQTVFCSEKGNCLQAAIATLLDIELHDAIDTQQYSDDEWQQKLDDWFEARGFEVDWWSGFNERKGIKGFFIAVVPSKYFDGKEHAVVINKQGMVVHDPNSKNPWWKGKNVFQEIPDFCAYFPYEDKDGE